jgi:hypothetical protein
VCGFSAPAKDRQKRMQEVWLGGRLPGWIAEKYNDFPPWYFFLFFIYFYFILF